MKKFYLRFMINGINFEIVNFPFLEGDFPRSPSYGVYILQLIRFATGWCCCCPVCVCVCVCACACVCVCVSVCLSVCLFYGHKHLCFYFSANLMVSN